MPNECDQMDITFTGLKIKEVYKDKGVLTLEAPTISLNHKTTHAFGRMLETQGFSYAEVEEVIAKVTEISVRKYMMDHLTSL